MLNNGSISLWDEDEAAYALFGKRMVETGDWINPDFIWSDIHRKTPFHFWSIALSFLCFGINEWALRLPAVLAIFATGAYLYAWAKRHFNPEVALYSWLIFASSLFANSLGKVALTDAALLACSMWAMGSLWDFLQTGKWKHSAQFWAAISIGMLVKGPPIIILTGGIYACCLLFLPNRNLLWRWYNFLFAAAALLPFVGWAYASYLQDGGVFLTFLYDWYVVKRVGGSVLGQSGWAGYHLGVLSLSLLAFLPFVWGGLAHFKNLYQNNKQLSLFLSFCLLFGWIFYELMSSKLPSYSIAAQPILALLGGIYTQNLREKQQTGFNWVAKIGFGVFFTAWLALIVGLFSAPFIQFPVVEAVATQLQIVGGILGLIWLTTAYFLYKKELEKLILSMAGLGFGLQLLAWGWIVPLLEQTPLKSLATVGKEAVIAQQKQPQITDNQTPIYLIGVGVKQTKPSLLFYLQQPFNLKKGFNFAEIKAEEWELLAKDKPSVAIIGTEAHAYFTDRNQLYPDMQRFEWWSSDDQLRPHNFYLLVKN